MNFDIDTITFVRGSRRAVEVPIRVLHNTISRMGRSPKPKVSFLSVPGDDANIKGVAKRADNVQDILKVITYNALEQAVESPPPLHPAGSMIIRDCIITASVKNHKSNLTKFRLPD